MIKKFKEYIKESTIVSNPLRGHLPPESYIEDVLSEEEIDDQFLRLKELYGCIITVDHTLEHKELIINIYPDHTGETCPISSRCGNINIEKIKEELDQVNIRIEHMFPVVICISKYNFPFQPKCYYYSAKIKLKE